MVSFFLAVYCRIFAPFSGSKLPEKIEIGKLPDFRQFFAGKKTLVYAHHNIRGAIWYFVKYTTFWRFFLIDVFREKNPLRGGGKGATPEFRPIF